MDTEGLRSYFDLKLETGTVYTYVYRYLRSQPEVLTPSPFLRMVITHPDCKSKDFTLRGKSSIATREKRHCDVSNGIPGPLSFRTGDF